MTRARLQASLNRLALALLAAGLGACSDFDGGLEPVAKLPAPLPRDTTGGDTDVARPTVAFVKPATSAGVDADWIEVEVAVTGFTPGVDGGVLLTVDQPGAAPMTQVLTATTGVVRRAPAGALTLRAELVDGEGAPIPGVSAAEVEVTATRVAPAIAIVRPDGEAFGLDAEIPWKVALTDFTLLAAGAAPTGPRQGRVLLALDDEDQAPTGVTSGVFSSVAAGAHTLKATLVDEAGAVWPGVAPDSASFTVDLPPAVTITSPQAGQTIEGTRVTVSIAPERFVLDGVDLAGHGTWRVSLDGALLASGLTGASAALSGIDGGAHTLTVELRTSNDEALSPPVTAEVAFETVLRPPTLDFVLPTATMVREGKVKVAVRPHYFSFSTAPIPGPLVAGTGGWRLLVDGVVVADRLTSAQTEIVLTPGVKQLTAQLLDNAGNPLSPVVQAKRGLEVVEVATSVQILSPRPYETVPLRFPVAVAFEDFTLSPDILPPNADPVPGRGHFHAFVRRAGQGSFVYQGFFLSETFELEVDGPGRWEVLVALHYENHSPVTPAVEALVEVTVDDRPAARLRSPREGSTIGRGLYGVVVQVDNFELIPLGEVSDERGHYHLFMDDTYQDFYLEPMTALDPVLTKPSALTPGAHELSAYLHRSDHTPVTGALGDEVSFTYDPTPKARFLTPRHKGTITTDPIAVEVEVDNLAIVAKAGQGNVAGEGHMHLFVDGVYKACVQSERFEVRLDSEGAHILRVTLHDNDHALIEGSTPGQITVSVDAAPHVDIVAPEHGGFTYGGDVEVLLEGRNLGDGAVELWLDDVLIFEGLPGLAELPFLTEGEHELYTVPLDALGAPRASGVIVRQSFEVLALGAPRVSFVSPAPNATVAAGSNLEVGVTGFSLEAGLGRRPAVPGDGLWTLSVVGRPELTWGPFAGSTVKLPALPRGPLTLRAELWHRDGSRVVPAATADLPLQIGGTGPRISLRSPVGEAVWYGPEIEVAVDSVDLTFPKDGTGQWLAVRVDGRPEALFPRARGVIGPLAPGTHVIEVEALMADRQAFTPAVVASTTVRVGGTTAPVVSFAVDQTTTVTDGAIDLRFDVTGMALEPDGIGARHVPGQGVVLVRVDGRVHQIATASPVRVEGLSPGAHTIVLELASLDLVPILPAARATLDVR